MPTLYEFGPNYQLKVTEIPEDPQAPLKARIAALVEQNRLLRILADGCAAHKSYRAIRKPSGLCPWCAKVWEARQALQKGDKP